MDAETFAEVKAVIDSFNADEITHAEMIIGVSAITGLGRNAVEYIANQLAMKSYYSRSF